MQKKTQSQNKSKISKKSKKISKPEIEKPLPLSDAKFEGRIVDSYPEYDLTAEKIVRNGKDTNTQLIIKNDKHYHFSNRYKVLPNEEAFKVAERVKADMNLIWGEEMKKDWRGPLTIPKYMGNMDRAITSLLIDPKEINITAGTKEEPDWIRFGVGIGNSIDGSSSLKSFGFSFRQICGNYAFHKFHLGDIKVDAEINPGEFNDAKILNKAIFIHSKQIDIETFEESVREVLKAGKLIIKRYQAMKIDKLLEKQALELAQRMPSTILKESDEIQKWLPHEKKKGFAFNKKTDISLYKAFNDITQALTHNEALSFRVRMNGFRRLDNILVAPQAN